MPIECEFKSNGVIFWSSGVITGKEMLQSNKEAYSHQYDEALEFQLADVSDVDEFDISMEDMTALAKMDNEMKKDKKQFACVVAPSDILFGMFRSWNIQSNKNDFENNVVRSMDEAIAWFKSKGIYIKIEKSNN